MTTDESLSTLLSQVLIAFTIEFDNEFERQMMASPYRPFLVSMVMWSNFMRLVPEEGIHVKELSTAAGVVKPVHPSLPGMERWGYVTVERDRDDTRAKPPRGDMIVRSGLTGEKAQDIWRPLTQTIEDRWRQRFGTESIDALTESLRAVVDQIDKGLPHYLPVLMSNDLFTKVNETERTEAGEELGLPALLSQVLLPFTLDFERESELSLPSYANVVRVLDEAGTTVRDLPRLSGVSKEAISMAMTFLTKNGFVAVEPDPDQPRTKLARLTAKGREAQRSAESRLHEVEGAWRSRFGEDAIHAVRTSLEAVISHERFSQGLVPHEGGWRAKKPYVAQTDALLKDPRGSLPHHPMVLHRGGWPDGS